MNDLKIPLLNTDALKLLTTAPFVRGDRLKLMGDLARWAAIPFLVFLIPILVWDIVPNNPVLHAVLFALIIGGFGVTAGLMYASMADMKDMDVGIEEWRFSMESFRFYVENSAPNIENVVIQRGKNSVANVGNTQNNTTNVLGNDAVKELNRQYTVARVILDLLGAARGRKTPKPFSYKAVNEALSARGLATIEHPDWASAIGLLEGTVLENGVASSAWKQLATGNEAESRLDETMRDKGLDKTTIMGDVEWRAE